MGRNKVKIKTEVKMEGLMVKFYTKLYQKYLGKLVLYVQLRKYLHENSQAAIMLYNNP